MILLRKKFLKILVKNLSKIYYYDFE